MNRLDLQKLAGVRLEEAKLLLDHKKYAGAYYLAGYAVECGLKACIAKKTKRHGFPDKDLANKCYTHDLEKLVELAGLKTLLQADNALMANWVVVNDWDEASRYERKTRQEARRLYDAITDAAHGGLPWIQSHW